VFFACFHRKEAAKNIAGWARPLYINIRSMEQVRRSSELKSSFLDDRCAYRQQGERS
jgi:hypothetical protein